MCVCFCGKMLNVAQVNASSKPKGICACVLLTSGARGSGFVVQSRCRIIDVLLGNAEPVFRSKWGYPPTLCLVNTYCCPWLSQNYETWTEKSRKGRIRLPMLYYRDNLFLRDRWMASWVCIPTKKGVAPLTRFHFPAGQYNGRALVHYLLGEVIKSSGGV